MRTLLKNSAERRLQIEPLKALKKDDECAPQKGGKKLDLWT
jgi:hypothetical protein